MFVILFIIRLNQVFQYFKVIESVLFFFNLQLQALFCAIVKLFVTTDQKVKLCKEQNINISHIKDWENLLSETIHDDLAVMWMYLAGKFCI